VTDADLALQQARQQLLQVENLAALGHLAPCLVHELNTPLGVILSNLSVLAGYGESLAQLRGGPPSADLDYILEDLPALTTESIASANRIAEIVQSIGLFAQRNAQRLTAVDVEVALEAAITLTWHELKQRATINRDFAGVPPVTGSASELAHVFVHVLRNAAHAVPQRGGLVSVSTAHADGRVTIRIADNGNGIPAETSVRAFEPFFTTRPDALGLGLSIAHEIVTRHQGTLDLESGPNGGTTVTVYLPVAVA
jgi:signal transduction histidine kinase